MTKPSGAKKQSGKAKKTKVKNDTSKKIMQTPEMSVLEFYDIAKRFAKRGPEHEALITAIIEDPDVMTRDTGRINKTSLCKETNIKSKRVDDLILELREAMSD